MQKNILPTLFITDQIIMQTVKKQKSILKKSIEERARETQNKSLTKTQLHT